MGIYQVQANGQAPKGLVKDDLVVTGGGTYVINGVKDDGSYDSAMYNKDQTTYNYKGAYDRPPDSMQQQVETYKQQGQANGTSATAFASGLQGMANDIKNYSDPWASQIKNQNAKVQNYGAFTYEPYSYDQKSDIKAANVKQTGTREIRRAVEDALGNYAAATGGQASTAAVSAASQAGDYYAAQLTDQLNDVENEAYARWSNDRDFAYRQWADQFNVELSKLSALQSLSDSDFDRFMSQMTAAAEIEGTAFQANFEMASLAAQYGDYSLLNQMGIDTTAYQKAQASDAAAAAGMAGLYYKVNPNGWAPEGLSVSDMVVTNGGTYMITGYNSDGSYQSKLVDKNTTPANFTGYYANASNPNLAALMQDYGYSGSSGGGGGYSGGGGGGYSGGGSGYSSSGASPAFITGGPDDPVETALKEKTGGGSMSYNDLARYLSNNAANLTPAEAAAKIAHNSGNLTQAELAALREKYVGV